MTIVVECMNAVTGTVRHPMVFTPADYEISRETTFTRDNWCRQCLLEYLSVPEGIEVWEVTLLPHRPIENAYDERRHNEVMRLHSENRAHAKAQ